MVPYRRASLGQRRVGVLVPAAAVDEPAAEEDTENLDANANVSNDVAAWVEHEHDL